MPRIPFAAVVLILSSSLAVLSACGHEHANGYPTFQECWTDHHINESLTAEQAIAVCCLEHPIGGQDANIVCGADQTACETYVTASLMPADATTTEITAGCADYITQRGM